MAPFLFLVELLCGVNLAFKALQETKLAKEAWKRNNREAATREAYRAGRHSLMSVILAMTCVCIYSPVIYLLVVNPPKTPLITKQLNIDVVFSDAVL